jgi:hypothetical protein
MSKFKIKLDYETLDQTNFEDIANKLLNESYLKINNVKYRLVEIEFYLRNNNHPDMYVHANPEQLLTYKYYFHRFGNGTYKAGTFKGMDIVFGNADSNTYFGILIRAILNTETDVLIEGPCNVVNHILESYEYDTVSDLTENESVSIRKNSDNFILRSTTKFDSENLYRGPRIGLSGNKTYVSDPYRYCIFQKRIKKQKTKLLLVEESDSA